MKLDEYLVKIYLFLISSFIIICENYYFSEISFYILDIIYHIFLY